MKSLCKLIDKCLKNELSFQLFIFFVIKSEVYRIVSKEYFDIGEKYIIL